MVIFLRNPRALCAKATRTVGESRLEGEDSRSRAARASARHRSVQDERVAIRSSNGGISRQGTQSKDVPEEVIGAVRSNLTLLRQEWDRMYPANGISSTEREYRRRGKSRDE